MVSVVVEDVAPGFCLCLQFEDQKAAVQSHFPCFHPKTLHNVRAEPKWRTGDLTLVKMGLFCHFIVRIAICIDGSVELFECHQSRHELIIGIQECSQPLLGLNMLNLFISQRSLEL